MESTDLTVITYFPAPAVHTGKNVALRPVLDFPPSFSDKDTSNVAPATATAAAVVLVMHRRISTVDCDIMPAHIYVHDETEGILVLLSAPPCGNVLRSFPVGLAHSCPLFL